MTAQNIRTTGRISYELNQFNVKQDRLLKLDVGTPAYNRCMLSMHKTAALIESLQQKLAARLDGTAPRRKVVAVTVGAESEGDVEFELHSGNEPANSDGLVEVRLVSEDPANRHERENDVRVELNEGDDLVDYSTAV